MDDLQQLYQDIILQHNKRPHNEGPLPGHTHDAEGYNPLCGDKVHVFLKIEDGRVAAVRITGEGCAISRASASIMTDQLAGIPAAEIPARTAEISRLLTDTEAPAPDLAEAGDLAALAGVRRFPARIKCATLAWHAAAEAAGSDSSKPDAS